jgi:hypothetical protein
MVWQQSTLVIFKPTLRSKKYLLTLYSLIFDLFFSLTHPKFAGIILKNLSNDYWHTDSILPKEKEVFTYDNILGNKGTFTSKFI